MTKQAGGFFLAALTALAWPSFSSAAVFELRHSFRSSDATPAHLHTLDPPGFLLQTALVNGSGRHLSSEKLGRTNSVDLLWAAISDDSPFASQPLRQGTDRTVTRVETDDLLLRRSPHNAATVPTEGTAPEIWAVILIAAGLMWSQLRRKPRHGMIRFTPP